MKRKRGKAPRKPQDLYLGGYTFAYVSSWPRESIWIGIRVASLNRGDAQRLQKWLTQASEYLEYKKRKEK